MIEANHTHRPYEVFGHDMQEGSVQQQDYAELPRPCHAPRDQAKRLFPSRDFH